MDNPFKKRATEYLSEASTLLPLLSPAPLAEFFRVDGSALLEKLTIVVGTPGCGKTTIARILEFDTLDALARNPKDTNKELVIALAKIGLLSDLVPTILAYRLPMSTNFRAIWELPYSEDLRATLLRSFVQAKAVLGWFRQLEKAEISENEVDVVFSDESDAAKSHMSGYSAKEFRTYARYIESAIFRAATSLIAPNENELATDFINQKFDAFEDIIGFRISGDNNRYGINGAMLKPMVVIDDAHELHPTQYILLREWLKNRNIRVSRWMMCRPDIVSPEDYRNVLTTDISANDVKFGTSSGRDYFIKLVQLSTSRKNEFRKIAADISQRYLPRIPDFSRRSSSNLRQLLETKSHLLPKRDVTRLKNAIQSMANNGHVSERFVEELRTRLPVELPEDETLAALRILLTRELNRTPQLSLIDEPEELDAPVTEHKSARTSLIEGARIQLLHEFNRPYYFGLDKLADASNANIEQFINLSGVLIDEMLAKLVRGKKPELDAKTQNDALVKQAKQMIDEWDFPYHSSVKDLVNFIASRCISKTMEPNAPLDDGANAIGIPQEEFNAVLERSERLTRILHYAFAYKAIIFVPHYKCKNREWCLLELGGVPCLANGLTLGRGGFIEDTLSGLQAAVKE
ncbi:MAG: hypothetical protein CML06_17155 [Pseudomonadales bacterium]|nr:hypothetical protein [Pseudomonadales bacterium]